jgi:uncharacterized membrane protein YdjX (TVP38/TMEM64 family)
MNKYKELVSKRKWSRLILMHLSVVISFIIMTRILMGDEHQETWRVFCATFGFAGILFLDIVGVYFTTKSS